MAIVVGLFVLVKWIGYIRNRKGVSTMNKVAKIGIVVALLVVVGVVVATKSGKQRPAANQMATMPATGPAASTPEGKLPRLVDLGADKCIPCKMMAPMLEELRAEYAGKFQVDFIDVWKDPEAGRKYNIRLIPTQIFYDAAGRELFRHEGFISKQDILTKWKELGIDVAVEIKK